MTVVAVECSPAELARLAALLPHVPRFVETRTMLLGGHCEIFGLEEDVTSPNFEACVGEDALILVVGRPSRQTIIEATHRIEGGGEVLTTPENVSHFSSALPGREATPATLHLLGDDASLAEVPRGWFGYWRHRSNVSSTTCRPISARSWCSPSGVHPWLRRSPTVILPRSARWRRRRRGCGTSL